MGIEEDETILAQILEQRIRPLLINVDSVMVQAVETILSDESSDSDTVNNNMFELVMGKDFFQLRWALGKMMPGLVRVAPESGVVQKLVTLVETMNQLGTQTSSLPTEVKPKSKPKKETRPRKKRKQTVLDTNTNTNTNLETEKEKEEE